jgi:alkylation response protein AidB-like acyl-CoA dehydrogenase
VNFDLTEDEEMLKALVERFVEDHYDPDKRRDYLAAPEGFSRKNWTLMGELGLIALPFAPENGGLGANATALATIFEVLGRGLVVEPLGEATLLAGGLFERLATEELKSEWMPALVAGEKRLAFAHREAAARDNMAWVEMTTHDGRLTGEKSLVVAGAGADGYLVSARLSGAPGGDDEIGIFFVEASAPGLSIESWRLVDGAVGATLRLQNVDAVSLGGSLADIEAVMTRITLAQSAEALGIMERLFAETLEYLKTRKQFGAALGTFQALQHRMAAQYSQIEQARALLNLAMMTDPDDESAWRKAVDGARAFIADASVALGHEMIQMHGGMGVTDELIVGHGHKRLMMLSRWPESAARSFDRYAGIA